MPVPVTRLCQPFTHFHHPLPHTCTSSSLTSTDPSHTCTRPSHVCANPSHTCTKLSSYKLSHSSFSPFRNLQKNIFRPKKTLHSPTTSQNYLIQKEVHFKFRNSPGFIFPVTLRCPSELYLDCGTGVVLKKVRNFDSRCNSRRISVVH